MSDPSHIIDIITDPNSDLNSDPNSDSDKEVCSICLEPFNNLPYLEHHKHYFHRECMQKYVKISKKSMPIICPVCNNKESTISKEVIFPDGIIDNCWCNWTYCDLYLAFFKIIYTLGIFVGCFYLGKNI
jgi:hypothetical protein